MPKETERIFRLMDRYFAQNGLEMTEENVDLFMKALNSGEIREEQYDDNAERSIRYYEQALEAPSKKKAIELLDYALNLDSNNLDAFLFLQRLKTKDDTDFLAQVKKREESVYENYRKSGFLTENKGHFYAITSTRPYIRMLRSIVEVSSMLGDYETTIRYGKKILTLNRHDNTGVRYILSGLYVNLRDFASFETLWRKFPGEGSSFYLADKALVAGLQGNLPLYQRRLAALKKANLMLYYFFLTGETDWLDDRTIDSYVVDSVDEAQVYFEEHIDILESPAFHALPKHEVHPADFVPRGEKGFFVFLASLCVDNLAAEEGKEGFALPELVRYLHSTNPDRYGDLGAFAGIGADLSKETISNLLESLRAECLFAKRSNGLFVLMPRGGCLARIIKNRFSAASHETKNADLFPDEFKKGSPSHQA